MRFLEISPSEPGDSEGEKQRQPRNARKAQMKTRIKSRCAAVLRRPEFTTYKIQSINKSFAIRDRAQGLLQSLPVETCRKRAQNPV
jgi:hypothetical protein